MPGLSRVEPDLGRKPPGDMLHAAIDSVPPRKTRKRPPHDRTVEQLWRHYQVEKALAEQLKRADRAARRAIYDRMYDELFERVRDHPRLTRPADAARTDRNSRNKLQLLRRLLRPDMTIAEIAPGDCLFLTQIAARVRFAYGVDICDQRPATLARAKNLQLIVYDGYDTREIADASLDLVFSDQLIEHLHPQDTAEHFRFVKRLLKPGGSYLFRTPHALTGPHDISAYFSDEPLGFHLKEWTYGELDQLLAQTGFRQWKRYWALRNCRMPLPGAYFNVSEGTLSRLPKKFARPVARLLLPTVEVIAQT